MTAASSKLAKAQETAALKGMRAAVPLYLEATNALASERRWDSAVNALAEVLNAREKKRGLFGSKEINPLGTERAKVAAQFAKLTRSAQINDPLLELLATLATENPDDPGIRLANAEGLYRAAYVADAIDEYRYCEKLIPGDGGIVARLGELYALMSRNAEAVEHLQRGIAELMQAQRFDEVPAFSQKLLEVSPQSASDISGWLESISDEAFGRQHGVISKIVESARDLGLDDSRWTGVSERLSTIPPTLETEETPYEPAVDDAEAAFAGDVAAPAEGAAPDWAAEPAEPAESKAHSAWDDISSVEPASDDEIRILFGSSEPTQVEPAPAASANGSPKTSPPPKQRETAPGAPAYSSSVSIGSTQPTTGGGLPPGLAAFTRRKGDAAFNAGDFAAAAASYERLLKAGFDADVAAPLVECYLGLERFSDASTLGLQLADHQAESGELEKALATLGLILEHTSDPAVERRREELAAANTP